MNSIDSARRSRAAAAQAIALAGALAMFVSASADAGDFYHWLQYTPAGLEARAITQDDSCPKASIDGRDAAMAPRAPANDAFPILACSLHIPKGAKDAAIDGRRLALPAPRMDKILLIGDTGCRLNGLVAQDCNSSADWPFRIVADLGAKMAPDLVIHLGDYLYRESACPWLLKGCSGSPWGDNWNAWKADFFTPAGALLSSAPWVLVRGNHEICERSGRGWSRMLDSYPFAADTGCLAQHQPFTVDLGELTLLVLDVAAAEDRSANAQQADIFKRQFASAGAVNGPVWLAMHKPIFSAARTLARLFAGDNKTLGLAARDPLPSNVQAILAGHLHAFQIASYVEDFPAHIIEGQGGAMLDRFAAEKLDGLVINGVTVEHGRGVPGVFGFAMLERGADEWLVTDYDVHGKPLSRCRLRGRKIDCE
ncbi:MAG: metallophosphoesterase [Methylocystis sp.]|nr:metallophosphoesterase [Methylocystis sp.]